MSNAFYKLQNHCIKDSSADEVLRQLSDFLIKSLGEMSYTNNYYYISHCDFVNEGTMHLDISRIIKTSTINKFNQFDNNFINYIQKIFNDLKHLPDLIEYTNLLLSIFLKLKTINPSEKEKT